MRLYLQKKHIYSMVMVVSIWIQIHLAELRPETICFGYSHTSPQISLW